MTEMTKRCKWCRESNEEYVKYHDNEWGRETHDDDNLYELLVLEPFQAGLSWETILNRRDAFKRAFDGYDREKICSYGDEKIDELMHDSSIIRNRRKIEAAVNNSRIFCDIVREWGSFDRYIWHFTEGKTIYETGKTSSELSDRITADLKKRGMKFIGTTVVYSYLQAIGVIYSHDEDCFLYRSK